MGALARVCAAVVVAGTVPVACAAPVPKAATGPAAEAVQKGLATGMGRFDHSDWNALLARHVDAEGRVDYAGIRDDRAPLDAYLGRVARSDLASLSRGELLALLVNAYNACTMRLILDNAKGGRFPNIREVKDPWGHKSCALGGETVSLDTIEHGLLRPLFKDTRIHAAVNCASKSCPPMAPWAFTGERIDEQLEERMRSMVDSDRHVRLQDGRLLVSKIFDWYGDDFAGTNGLSNAAPSLREYLLRHAGPRRRQEIEALPPSLRVEFLDYDWALNGQ